MGGFIGSIYQTTAEPPITTAVRVICSRGAHHAPPPSPLRLVGPVRWCSATAPSARAGRGLRTNGWSCSPPTRPRSPRARTTSPSSRPVTRSIARGARRVHHTTWHGAERHVQQQQAELPSRGQGITSIISKDETTRQTSNKESHPAESNLNLLLSLNNSDTLLC